MGKLKTHGITENTPKEILLGAGAYYKNLKYDYKITKDSKVVTSKKYYTKSDNTYTEVESPTDSDISTYYELGWDGTILGATTGGGKVAITPEYMTIEADGATVKVKGLEKKVGETANMEINLIEFKEDNFVQALHMVEDTTKKAEGYKIYKSVRDIDDDAYFENVAFVGTLTNGEQVIVIFENAIVEGAMELEPKNKEVSSMKVTAECTASFEQDDLEHLPYYIYFPQSEEVGV